MKKGIFYFFSALVGLAFVVGHPSTASSDEFYKGKTIRFIVGFAPGGGYDTYTRAVARHIRKHIPGNPTTTVENMDGAGSLLAANFVYNRASPDGLTVANFNSGLITQQALGSIGIRFDGRRYAWIGAPGTGVPVCAVMGFTGLKTLDDVLASKKEIKMGGTRSGATTDDLPKLTNELMGTKFKPVPGYKGTSEIRLGMQRKELDGACWTWDSMRVTARAMLDAQGDKKLTPFIIHGKSEDPEVKDLPQFTKVIKKKEDLNAFKAWANAYDFQRPLAVPPKTPKDRLNVLRKAFAETLKDPEFLAEAKKSKLLVEHVPGEKIEKLVDEILAFPPAAKERLKFLQVGAGKK